MTASRIADIQDRVQKLHEVPGGKRSRRDPDDAKAAQETEARSSAATQLAELLLQAKAELWHSPDREPFATFKEAGDVVMHVPVYSGDFTELAQRIYYLKTNKAIASDAVKAAVNTVAADAKFAGAEYEVHSRIAHDDDVIWIDLGDSTWDAIRIDARRWQVVPSQDVPVKFRRTQSTRPLPRPQPGGSLEDLRTLFRMQDTDWHLLAGWIVGVFQGDGARAHLELIGEQGSGKSTLARLLVALLDPTSIPGRSFSKDEESMLIALRGRAVLAYDNVSMMSSDMKDALCRISTGGGIGKRKLHSDQDEILIEAQMPVIWTSIVPVAVGRPDLQERTVTVHLDSLDETAYRSEREINATLKAMLPGIVAAVYSTVSTALRNRETIQLERRPRLADFAEWVEAASPALEWEPGTFVSALEAAGRIAAAQAIDSSPVGRLIVDLMRYQAEWSGQASDLLKTLKERAEDDERKQRNFPKDATRLSREIRRLQRPLSLQGVIIEFERSNRARGLIIRRDDDEFSGNDDALQRTSTQTERVRGATLPPPDAFQCSQQQQRITSDGATPTMGQCTAEGCTNAIPPHRKYHCDACAAHREVKA